MTKKDRGGKAEKEAYRIRKRHVLCTALAGTC